MTTLNGISRALFKRANDGEPDAQFELATHYRDGRGTTKNLKKAFAWFRQAALNGHPQAMLALSQCHLHHRGTRSNLCEAYIWALLFHACVESPDAATFAGSLELILSEEDMLAAQDEGSVRHQILCERPLTDADLTLFPDDPSRKRPAQPVDVIPAKPAPDPIPLPPAPSSPAEQPSEADDEPEPSPNIAYKYARQIKKNFDPALVELELVVTHMLKSHEDMDFSLIKVRYNKKDTDAKPTGILCPLHINRAERKLLVLLAAQNSLPDEEKRVQNIRLILSEPRAAAKVSRLNRMFVEIFPGCATTRGTRMVNRQAGVVNVRLKIDTTRIHRARDFADCLL